MAETPYVHCVYAEDIRQEATGQCTIVGAHQSVLKLDSVPATLPKLAIHADLIVPNSELPANANVWLKFNDEIIQDLSIPLEILRESHKSHENLDSLSIRIALVAMPFEVKSAGKIWLEVRYGADVFRSNELTFLVKAADASK